MVTIRPTKDCLIAISEFPFFVVDLKDIETVHFERVAFGIKNFDMAIIFKDYHTWKRINSIPRESIEEIKTYLNGIGVIYSEGVVPMSWNAVLAQIREDFGAFLEAGAWRFLQEDENEAAADGEDSELAGDSEFADDDSGSDVDSAGDSDFSDAEEDDDYSSEVDGDESEGLSWDELEKRALEDDRTAAQRRHQQNDDRGRKPTNQRRRR